MSIKTILAPMLFAALSIGLPLHAAYPRAGYEAHLSTLAHNVSGKVTILDARTVVVENFNYDGGGPAVYFYLGATNTNPDFLSGIGIGPLLTGTVYSNDRLIIKLPGSTTLDGYNAISVWCVDFSVNFGSGTFLDPDPVVSWTFGNAGTQSYVLDAFSPTDIDFGTLGTEDPTLVLELAKRYQVTVTNYGPHPFEVIAKDASAASDTVLLSMSGGGSLQTDTDIRWEYDGAGTAAFTVTQDLVDAMTVPDKRPGYRCGIHTSAMRGDFDICTDRIEADLDRNCRVDIFDFADFSTAWMNNNLIP